MTVLDELAGRLVATGARRRLRIAVDGGSCTGKTTFADALARAVEQARPVVRASVDGFHRPRSERYRRGRSSPVGCYEDTFDHDALWSELLAPFGPDGSGRHRVQVHDWRTDRRARAPLRTAAPDAVLVVDGLFLQRPELTDAWDLVVLLVASEAEVLRRAVVRDTAVFGSSEAVVERYRTRYLPAEALYARRCRPELRADVVVDNDDPERPLLRPGPDRRCCLG